MAPLPQFVKDIRNVGAGTALLVTVYAVTWPALFAYPSYPPAPTGPSGTVSILDVHLNKRQSNASLEAHRSPALSSPPRPDDHQ